MPKNQPQFVLVFNSDDPLLPAFQRFHEVLCAKAKEYAKGSRFSNFETMQDVSSGYKTPIKAAWDMPQKHIVKFSDLLNAPSLEAYEEMGGDGTYWECVQDIGCYMILLYAMKDAGYYPTIHHLIESID